MPSDCATCWTQQPRRACLHRTEIEDLEADEILALALVRLLEILREAAARVSPEVQAQFPAIPWRQMTGTRNRLIHGYFNVDLDIVWAIIQNDFPACIAALEAIVPLLADT